MTTISPIELNQWRADGKAHQLIDVREDYELEICSIGGEHIPMNEIMERMNEIRKDIPVVIHCKSGRRSEAVVAHLMRYGYQNACSLDGGIIAWIESVQPALEKY
jgi:adenylyltransferase/sulfurtransferase